MSNTCSSKSLPIPFLHIAIRDTRVCNPSYELGVDRDYAASSKMIAPSFAPARLCASCSQDGKLTLTLARLRKYPRISTLLAFALACLANRQRISELID